MRKSKSALFLMELIIVIFFFSLTSAVCLRVFVKAHLTANASDSLSKATLWATNVGECFYDFRGNEGLICHALNIADEDTNDGHVLFSIDDERYQIALTFTEDNDFIYMNYAFSETVSDFDYSFSFKANKQEVVSK